jgi:hypothetical protein
LLIHQQQIIRASMANKIIIRASVAKIICASVANYPCICGKKSSVHLWQLIIYVFVAKKNISC